MAGRQPYGSLRASASSFQDLPSSQLQQIEEAVVASRLLPENAVRNRRSLQRPGPPRRPLHYSAHLPTGRASIWRPLSAASQTDFREVPTDPPQLLPEINATPLPT